MKEHNRKYSAIDFARYHSGIMLPDEMHALEKDALEDPFLADALDGYRYSKDAAKELGEMQARLDEKKKQQKVFSISSFSSGTWWKIAAMFILFGGAAYFLYTSNSKQEISLEVKNDVLKKPNPSTISPAKDDTTATEDNIAFEKTPSRKNENSMAKLPLPTTRSIEAQPNRKTLSGEIKTEKEKKILEEHLVQNKEKAIKMKSSDNAVSSNIIGKDSGEKSFFNSSDTTALVAASPGLYNRDNDNTVVMNKKNATLNEVVVVGYGTQKKKAITGAKLDGRVSGINVTASSLYPKDGKEKFDQYVKDNAIPVFDSTGKRITSNILLSFILNKKHKPAHIKVLESSCDACKKEAIRLLENGPNWIGNRGDSGTVRIQF